MDQNVLAEKEYVLKLKKENLRDFYDWVKKYDAYISQVMKNSGWKPVYSKERTVIFTFGEATYSRRVYKKEGKYRYPVDEKLGLKKNEKYSREFLYQVAELSKYMTYRQIPKVIEMMYQVYITKETVNKAIKITAQLLNDRDQYTFYEDFQESQKIKSKVIYIEGDGVLIHTRTGENRLTDLSHYVIHTGSTKVGKTKNRRELLNKKEVIAINRKEAVQKLIEVLTNFYDIDQCQILITNSDGGHGYTPYVFKEIAGTLNIKRHEHFWDAYHLNKNINDIFRGKNQEIKKILFNSIKTNNKKKAQAALDTQASLLDEENENFTKFSKRLMQRFHYTRPAKLRNLSSRGIGVMESQHVKITSRMKNRKMRWGEDGLYAMSRILIMSSCDLRELWFGTWRDEFEKYKYLPENISEYLRPVKETYKPYQGIFHLIDNGNQFK